MTEVEFHRVESGIDGHLGRIAELVDDPGDLVTMNLAAVRTGRRIDEPTRRQRGDSGQPFVCHDAGMPELRGDACAGRVHRIGEPLQAGQRFVAHHDLAWGTGRLW